MIVIVMMQKLIRQFKKWYVYFFEGLGLYLLSLQNLTGAFGQTYVAPASGSQKSLGLGEVAGNLTDAANIFQNVFNTVFYCIGFMFVFGSLIRYREHRMNPSQTPISKVIFLLMAGVVIGFFPFIVKFLGTKFSQTV